MKWWQAICLCALVIVGTEAQAKGVAGVISHANSASSSGNSPQCKPLSVQQTAPLSFGNLASGSSGGTVTISATTGARTATGNVAALNGGTEGQAMFTITGQPNKEVTITLPTSITIDDQGGTGTLTASNLKASPTGEIKLDGTGRAKISVGGTLAVPGSARRGNYNGSFDIDVKYD